ncbi:Sec-independent protein translocase protein TatB [Neptunomonas antarctica]|uniref:Sec-independent protein translocase protein TatB n=1 Tax=Neptunomonas antarctica TaxID=619304 RepID=A0A1N7IRD2_9GAMM|nr:Sec-independent protein translocase protein TatB [Neptunomonas antarctica]SIS39643.1 Sec-independent protein translocase TatB [Neptunomonas antarctica]
MFDIGFAEILVIGVVALIVLGPEKLPTAVRAVGLWVGKAKRAVSSIQSEISEELRLDEMRRTASIKKEELDKELNEMKQPFKQAFSDESPLSQSTAAPAIDPGTALVNDDAVNLKKSTNE